MSSWKFGILSQDFGRHCPKTPKLPENLTSILRVSWKISQVSWFPAKSSDSWKNFVFLPKKPFLELTPHVLLSILRSRIKQSLRQAQCLFWQTSIKKTLAYPLRVVTYNSDLTLLWSKIYQELFHHLKASLQNVTSNNIDWFADDHTCRLWDLETGTQKTSIPLGSAGVSVKWNRSEPNKVWNMEYKLLLYQ